MAEIHEDLRLYFREAGRLPLLDRAAEVRLGQAMDRARRASTAIDLAVSGAERAALERQIRAGEEASALFVGSNLRLVVSLAMGYQAQGLALADLVQEGNLGLMHAVTKYDWRRGFRFSSYATWWIRTSISRAVDTGGRVVRLPAYVNDQLRQLRAEAADFEAGHGRPPNTEELAVRCAMPVGRVTEIMSYRRSPLSLDQVLTDDAVATRGDLVGDPAADPSFDDACAGAVLTYVEHLLGHLDTREREILRLRFGLDRGAPRTLVEVARCCRLSKERIRQIEAQALAKLSRLTTPTEVMEFVSA